MQINSSLVNLKSLFEVLKRPRLYSFYFLVAAAAIAILALFVGLAYVTRMSSLLLVGGLLIAVVVFFGVQALGILVLTSCVYGENISFKDAIMQSLKTSHRLILLGLVLFGFIILFCLFCTIVALPTLIPYFGGIYTAIIFAPIALITLLLLVFIQIMALLVAPMVWSGLGVVATCRALVNAFAKNGVNILLWLLLLFVLILPLVSVVIAGFTVYAVSFTGSILVIPRVLFSSEGIFGLLSIFSPGIFIGTTIFSAAIASVAMLLLVRAQCLVYSIAIEGVDLDAPVTSLLSGLKAKAKQAQQCGKSAFKKSKEQGLAAVAATKAAAKKTTSAADESQDVDDLLQDLSADTKAAAEDVIEAVEEAADEVVAVEAAVVEAVQETVAEAVEDAEEVVAPETTEKS